MLRGIVILGTVIAVAAVLHHHGGWQQTPVWQLLIPVMVMTGFAAWGAMRVDSNYFIKTKCRGNTDVRAVALSFDDGPVEHFTPMILDVLQQLNVSASFFCIGNRAEKHPDLLRRIHEEGHLIGNHTYSHDVLFDLYPPFKMKAELQRTNEIIKELTGLAPKMFRPPYGVTNPMLASAVKSGKFTSVGWSVRSLDTVIKDEDKLFERVTKKIRPGDIFLFHDTCAATVKILPALIKQLQRDGFAIQRLDELLKVPAYA